MIRIATCCCVKASIEVEGDPKFHLVCHCNNCKKRTGSAFGVSVYFPDTQVRSKKGETKVYEIESETTQQERYFCKSCGTTLYWKIYKFQGVPAISEMTGIAGGCFDDNSLPEPTIVSSGEQKCSWLELPKISSAI